MDIKHNKNYFKFNDSLKIIGGVLLVVGLLLLWLGWSYISWILMLIFTPTGLAIFLYASIVRSNDADIMEDIEKALEDMDISIENSPHYNKRAKYQDPYTINGFEYDGDLLFQKARDGSVFSTKYTRSAIHILSDRLYVFSKTVSPVSDESENNVYDIPFDEIAKCEISAITKKVTYKKSYFLAKQTTLDITLNDRVVKLPIHNDVNSEEFIKKLNKTIISK